MVGAILFISYVCPSQTKILLRSIYQFIRTLPDMHHPFIHQTIGATMTMTMVDAAADDDDDDVFDVRPLPTINKY